MGGPFWRNIFNGSFHKIFSSSSSMESSIIYKRVLKQLFNAKITQINLNESLDKKSMEIKQ